MTGAHGFGKRRNETGFCRNGFHRKGGVPPAVTAETEQVSPERDQVLVRGAYSRREEMCLGKARHALRKWKKSPAAEPQEIFGSVKIHLDKSGRAGYNALVVPNWAIAKW